MDDRQSRIDSDRDIRIERVKGWIAVTVIIVNHNFFFRWVYNPVFPDT